MLKSIHISFLLCVVALFSFACNGSKVKKTKVSESNNIELNEDIEDLEMEEPEVITKVIVDPKFQIPEQKRSYSIEKVWIKDNQLMVSAAYSGGCEAHNFTLVSKNELMKSLPPKLILYLVHDNNNDNCRALINSNLNFDLEDLRQETPFTFQIQGWKEFITYK